MTKFAIDRVYYLFLHSKLIVVLQLERSCGHSSNLFTSAVDIMGITCSRIT